MILDRSQSRLRWIESLPIKVQVELESRFTGPLVTLLGGILTLDYNIPRIPILEECAENL
jgi:hypothetical protein